MKNWKDYVGHIVIPQPAPMPVFGSYVTATGKGIFVVNFSASDLFDAADNSIFVETENTIGTAVESALQTFPTVELTENYTLDDAKFNILIYTKIAPANTNWNNVWFYKSEVYENDQPLYVIQRGEVYGIIKHPNFSNYGFVI
ncbi:hypothetical protein M0R04_07620 [Candidatus Dojkabacteria bacterium]|jgi:hypothetical protein|nr:hypothetical protein [Candidatus Dojkabacteria bacterium]